MFAVLGLIALIPVFVIIAVAIKISSAGPVFFTQKRVGRNGKLFTIIKFRTMFAHNDANTITTSSDMRITKFGSFLRKWKLDELPELYNILIGEMSFVGPRPDVPGYADLLSGNERKILTLRPGITGPASLTYYNEEEILAGVEDPKEYNDKVIFPDKVRINLKYMERASLSEDLRIIYYTILRKKNYEY